jgi:hypothetical protein
VIARAASLFLILLAACGSGPKPGKPVAPIEIGLGLETLPDQDMPKDGCAVFLWRAGDPARLLLVARSDPPAAMVKLDGRVRSLPRTAVDGRRTSYADGEDRIAIEVTVEPRRGLKDGAVITEGSLTLDRAGGATMVVPVAGLIGCAG